MKYILITLSITACFLILDSAVNSNAIANDKKNQAIDLVEMFEKLGGKNPGFRKAHENRMCASGTFVPSPNEHLAGAALLSNGELPESMRFSLGSANPSSDEKRLVHAVWA